MLYVSIFLFIAGIALIVYSFLSSSSPSAHGVPMESVVKPEAERRAAPAVEKKSEPEAVSPAILPVEEKKKSPDAAPAVATVGKSSGTRTVEQKSEISPHTPQPAVGRAESEEKDAAVLYHDASGVVDYEGGASVIDPSFKKYSKLKRIGSGRVSVVGDGINFQLRKKLYRFEFQLIDKMVQGDNYLALFLKGNNEARLFIFKRGSGIEKKLAREYAAYRKKQI